ncbi:DUF962-domain-containing protein [Hysterangium stoloniferum]|nr:DUF962-domain-containing protein [Hysterangium stoloniferum]
MGASLVKYSVSIIYLCDIVVVLGRKLFDLRAFIHQQPANVRMAPGVFDVKSQLVFYGQYHANKYNVAIHMLFVPIILWTGLILLSTVPTFGVFTPGITSIYLPYLYFEWTWAALVAILYGSYYFILEPSAAAMYMPILTTMLLTAGPIASAPWGIKYAIWIQVIAWIAQFAGHGFAEGRSPALLDNLVGALVLAPFFVHLEILFACGYRPTLHKEVRNSVGVEIRKFRSERATMERAKLQ